MAPGLLARSVPTGQAGGTVASATPRMVLQPEGTYCPTANVPGVIPVAAPLGVAVTARAPSTTATTRSRPRCLIPLLVRRCAADLIHWTGWNERLTRSTDK